MITGMYVCTHVHTHVRMYTAQHRTITLATMRTNSGERPTEMFSSSIARLPRGAMAMAFFSAASWPKRRGFPATCANDGIALMTV